MSEEKRIESFEEFWPFYAGEHRSPFNRLLHYIGTSSAVILLAFTVIQFSSWWPLFVVPVVGYGFAWIGHFVVERNKPASFKYPLWSFFGDFKMLSYGLTGRMGQEMTRLYGSRHPAPDAPCLLENQL